MRVVKINDAEFRNLVDICFKGNITQTAKALDLNASTLSRIMAGKSKPGQKVYEAIIEYCKKNNIDYSKIILI